MTELVGPLASTGYWVKQAALSWQRELDAALRDLDLTSTQFSVLAGASWLSRGATTRSSRRSPTSPGRTG